MTKYYTLIGSRATPEPYCQKLKGIAHKLKQLGYVGRSGGATGADQCLEDGVGNENMNIYLPWNKFNGKNSFNRGYINVGTHHLKDEAEVIAAETHPAWDRCKQGVKALHTRNVYQVLGSDLNTPSEFVVYWSEYTKTLKPKGGTVTAVNLAKTLGIPTYNLNIQQECYDFYDMLEKL